MIIDPKPQSSVSVGIFANTSGFSIVLIEADQSDPVRYKVVHEFTDKHNISYQLIQDMLADLKSEYTLQTPYQINNLPSLQSALGGESLAEIREISNLIDEYTKVQTYWNDKRLSFNVSVENVFIKELNDFSKESESHKLKAFFLALGIERQFRLGVSSYLVENEALADVSQLFRVDNYPVRRKVPEYRCELPENYKYNHDWH